MDAHLPAQLPTSAKLTLRSQTIHLDVKPRWCAYKGLEVLGARELRDRRLFPATDSRPGHRLGAACHGTIGVAFKVQGDIALLRDDPNGTVEAGLSPGEICAGALKVVPRP